MARIKSSSELNFNGDDHFCTSVTPSSSEFITRRKSFSHDNNIVDTTEITINVFNNLIILSII